MKHGFLMIWNMFFGRLKTMNNKRAVKISKFLSLILRHKPEVANIELDSSGWACTKDILEACKIDLDELVEVVIKDDKGRYEFHKDGLDKIRACQGHSIDVDLGYEPKEPPSILYHGTSRKNAESILEKGLLKSGRTHVHLSDNIETAITVGGRHGNPIVFEVDTQSMYKDEYTFLLSTNKVWLTDCVPSKYLKLIKE